MVQTRRQKKKEDQSKKEVEKDKEKLECFLRGSPLKGNNQESMNSFIETWRVKSEKKVESFLKHLEEEEAEEEKRKKRKKKK